MTDKSNFSTGLPSDEMATYLQMFLDETSEQLDALVETLLRLEENSSNPGELNEAFRLIHSIKGSAAMMGFDSITVLTHQLENHFVRMRSGLQSLDQSMMNLVLRCVDFLKDCNQRLRNGQILSSAPELLEELGGYVGSVPESAPVGATAPAATVDLEPAALEVPIPEREPTGDVVPVMIPVQGTFGETPQSEEIARPIPWRIKVQFEAGLQLADLKAELIIAHLSDLGEVHGTDPPGSGLASVADSRRLQVLLTSDRPSAELRRASDIGGVARLDLDEGVTEFEKTVVPAEDSRDFSTAANVASTRDAEPSAAQIAASETEPKSDSSAEAPAVDTPAGESKSRMGETVRVDIDRLDNLLNLAGELVVTKARFVQMTRQMNPALKKPGRIRAIGETLRQLIDMMKSPAESSQGAPSVDWTQKVRELESELDSIETQAQLWDEGRRCFGQLSEAVNQLARVSDGLQRGVLKTRMVPVGPLFNRFKRVVRDISQELGKKVTLEIHGEKTELDKRMIDDLGDPLVHLVRNAIDHGLEPTEIRVQRGKPEVGKLVLEAIHSGNNVYIHVRDDGGGISAARIRRRIVERGLIAADAAAMLSDAEAIEFIWHPGFSTAEVVSDISGRGVGMDIVKSRIAELNGAVSVDTTEGRGTTFSIRLPLTLAIIRCLLFRVRHGIFAVPIDAVREIVSVPVNEIFSIHGRHTCEVRGEFIPLVDIDDVFDWPGSGTGQRVARASGDVKEVNVVILAAMSETIGLRVEELQGGQDIVIKSLVENFMHIRGLSGASILGDGTVCLLLDVVAAIELAISRRDVSSTRELARIEE